MFRRALPAVVRAFKLELRHSAATTGTPGKSVIQRAVDAAASELRREYLETEAASVPATSERTERRKRGRPGEGKPLVGAG